MELSSNFMPYLFRKPIIQIKIENPSLRIGKTLTWAKLQVSGFCIIKVSCPALPDWRPIYLWISNSKKISKIVPTNAILVAHSWYLFGYFSQEFKIADSDWILETPAAHISKILPPLLLNLRQKSYFDNMKIFSFKKFLFLTKLSNTIIKKGISNNPISIGSAVRKVRYSIYLKRFSVNPKKFYEEEAVKDD